MNSTPRFKLRRLATRQRLSAAVFLVLSAGLVLACLVHPPLFEYFPWVFFPLVAVTLIFFSLLTDEHHRDFFSLRVAPILTAGGYQILSESAERQEFFAILSQIHSFPGLEAKAISRSPRGCELGYFQAQVWSTNRRVVYHGLLWRIERINVKHGPTWKTLNLFPFEVGFDLRNVFLGLIVVFGTLSYGLWRFELLSFFSSLLGWNAVFIGVSCAALFAFGLRFGHGIFMSAWRKRMPDLAYQVYEVDPYSKLNAIIETSSATWFLVNWSGIESQDILRFEDAVLRSV